MRRKCLVSASERPRDAGQTRIKGLGDMEESRNLPRPVASRLSSRGHSRACVIGIVLLVQRSIATRRSRAAAYTLRL